MKEIKSLDLLPKETRILFDEAVRKLLFSNKVEVMNSLNLHRNTVNSWIRGEYKPSIEQLERLGISVETNWKNIVSINLEGGRKKFLIPECLPINKLSWLLGILDGDGIKAGHRIGIVNQDTELVKTFMETCKEIFAIKKEDFTIEVQWYNKQHKIGQILGLDKIKTYSLSQYKSNKPIVRSIINNKILATVMENFRKFMVRCIERNNAEPFQFYVRGLLDSDGSFARKNIYLTQKLTDRNKIKMDLVKRILDASEIENFGVKGPNNKNMIYIYLSSNNENLKKFKHQIGFSSKPKMNKLYNLLS